MSNNTASTNNTTNNTMEDEVQNTIVDSDRTIYADDPWHGPVWHTDDRMRPICDTVIRYAGRDWAVRLLKDRAWDGKWNTKTRVFISTPTTFDTIATANHPVPTGAMFPHADREVYTRNDDGSTTVERYRFDRDDEAHTRRGEHPDVDKAWDAHNRSQAAGWQEVLRQVDAITKVGPVGFSRKAGCSCPCSPGFVAKEHRNETWFVTVTEVQA